MSSSYRRTVEKLAENADPARLACKWCGELSTWAATASLGARCVRCYDDFCSHGMKGGVDGFQQGAPDTADQRDMRKRLKASRPIGKPATIPVEPDVDTVARDAAKAEAARKVRDYAKRNGLSFADSEILLQGGRRAA